MIDKSQIEEMKNQANLSDIVGHYVKLNKVGNRMKGLCPFHNEKTPSFYVDDSRGLFHCFGCKASGDVYSFLEKIENISFYQSVQKVADIIGYKLKYNGKVDFDQSDKKIYTSLYAEFEKYYKKSLLKNSNAMNYLTQRGITNKEIEDFGLGYASNNQFDFLKMLISKYKINNDKLVEFGLCRNYNGKTLPFFYNRLMIPIKNLWGDCIAFGGRILNDDKGPKYLNTSENKYYKKKLILYNYHNVKNLRDNGNVFVVEGYFDVISLSQKGIYNVVAPLGTALTENHVKNLERNFEEVDFLFDNDEAGYKATMRSIEYILNSALNSKIVVLPKNFKDIDEFLRENDREEFLKIVDNSIEGIQFYFDKVLKVNNKNRNIEMIYKFLFEHLVNIEDPIRETELLKRISKIDNHFSIEELRDVYKKFQRNKVLSIRRKEPVKKKKINISKNVVSFEREFCYFILSNINYANIVMEYIKPIEFKDDFARLMYKQLLLSSDYGSFDLFIHSIENEEIKEKFFTHLDEEKYKENANEQLEDFLSFFKLRKLKKKLEIININIRELEKRGEFPKDLLRNKQILVEQIAELNKFRSKNKFSY